MARLPQLREKLMVPTVRSSEHGPHIQSLRTAVVLTGLLVGAVPIVWSITGISSLILVPLAGVLYCGYLWATEREIIGFGTAVFVLLTFHANVPIVSVPGVSSINLYLFDAVLLPVAVITAYWFRRRPAQFHQLGRIAIAALGLFTVWSLVAAIFGAGPSTFAGLSFSLEQGRYFLLLVTTALYVTYTDPRCAVYPLVVAVTGHTLFAFVQAYHGSIVGMTYLGEASSAIIRTINIGPVVYQAGLHTGGFTGSSRLLVGLVLLLSPVLFVMALGSRRRMALGFLGVSVAGVVVLMGDTDAGWGAFVLEMLVLALLLASLFWLTSERQFRVGTLVTLPIVGLNLLLRYWQSVESVVWRVRAMVFGGSFSDRDGSSSDPGTGLESPESNTGGGGTGGAGSQAGDVNVVDTSTLGIRLKQYTSGIGIGLEYPLFGLGGYNYNIVAPTYGVPQGMVIHNTYLAYLVAAGLPGLLFFVSSVGAVTLLGLLTLYRSTGFSRKLSVGLIAGMAGFLGMSFWTTMHTSAATMGAFWVICGTCIGMSGRFDQ